ncbi:DUF2834 domain-containing protein [Phormidium tenue FACHB-886]|nr:DUF2834 domain-containing protein [Phormidium tenue FACHB-886]
MTRKIALWSLWVGFVTYAFLFAPPNQPNTLQLIQDLSTGNWQGVNPLVVALFNIMGVLPLLYATVIYLDGRGQKLPAWTFSGLSFGVGIFALLPYMALRQPNPSFVGEKNWWLKLIDSWWFGGAVAVGAIGLLSFGISQGNWSDFVQQWQTSRFIHVMSLDFCLLCLLFPVLLPDDMARRGLKEQWIFWAVTLLPLIGALAYVTFRPPIQKE